MLFTFFMVHYLSTIKFSFHLVNYSFFSFLFLSCLSFKLYDDAMLIGLLPTYVVEIQVLEIEMHNVLLK